VLLSHSHKFIFVHIQKTAGQSLKTALQPYCRGLPRTGLRRLLSHLPVPEDADKAAFRVHATARGAPETDAVTVRQLLRLHRGAQSLRSRRV